MSINVITSFQFWILILTQIAGFVFLCIMLYVKSYSSEKGKNLATKEDTGRITTIVEDIRNSYVIKTEEIKSELSYKNEHLIHLRAAERTAIINYYKATWALVLNLERVNFLQEEIDGFDQDNDTVTELELRKYNSTSVSNMNKVREDIVNLQYLKEISESELAFFADEDEIGNVIKRLNLSLSKFDRDLSGTITQLLLLSRNVDEKMGLGKSPTEVTVDLRRSRSNILTEWKEKKLENSGIIRTFNVLLKEALHKRLKSLTF